MYLTIVWVGAPDFMELAYTYENLVFKVCLWDTAG